MKKLINLDYKIKYKFKEFSGVFFMFSLLKSLVYFTPLLMISIIPNEVYGNFEYSINLGQIILGFLSPGFSGSYAYYITTKNQDSIKSIFHFHFVFIISLNVLLCCGMPILLTSNYYAGFLIGLILANQLLMSTIEKLNGKNLTSIVIDSFMYILLFIYLLYLYIFNKSFSFFIWNILILLILSLNVLIYHIPQIKIEELKSLSGFKKVYSYGGLMLVASPLVVLNTSSTRLYIEHFLGLDKVALFSFFYRIATFSLLIYKVLIILLFKRIFIKEFHVIDNYFWKLAFLVFGFNFIVLIISNIFFRDYLGSYVEEGYNYQYLMLLCGFHILFWINNAFLEPIFQRLNALKPYIFINFFSVLLLFATMYIYQSKTITIEILIFINIITLILSGFTQIIYLKTRDIYFKKLLFTHLIFTGSFLFASSVL